MASNEFSPDALTLLREYVHGGTIMQLATSSPWSAHCWYAADENLNLIFLSKTSRRHSADIMRDSSVSAAIIHQIPTEGPGQKVRGVVLEGSAAQVPSSDLDVAYEIFARRWRSARSVPAIDVLREPGGLDKLWRIVPRAFVFFDEVDFPGSPRQEFLSW